LKASSESTGWYRANGVPVRRGNTGGLLLLKWVWRLREAARKSGWKVYSRQGSLSGAINCQKKENDGTICSEYDDNKNYQIRTDKPLKTCTVLKTSGKAS
jgi:hypothetical protein